MSHPAITVIVPCYNSAWSIARTLLSIQAQTFTDFEVLVINDGSRDNLHEVVAPFVERDPRIRVIDQQNRGLAGARNRGIAEAAAELVAPVDSDDLWHPEFLSSMVDALEGSPDAPFAYAHSLRVDVEDRLIPSIHFRKAPRHDVQGLISFNSVGSGSAAVYRKKALEEVGGFDESMGHRGLHGAEDWKLVVQLAALAPPVRVDRDLVVYRFVPTGMSQSDPQRQLDAIVAVIDDLKIALPQIDGRWFADGLTSMTGWLLTAFLRKRDLRRAFRAAKVAYLDNPGWFLNPNVRAYHMAGISLLLGRAMSSAKPGLHIGQLQSGGERPFAFLGKGDAVNG